MILDIGHLCIFGLIQQEYDDASACAGKHAHMPICMHALCLCAWAHKSYCYYMGICAKG